MTEHPNEQVPLRISDEDLVTLGALIRGRSFGTEATGAAVQRTGVRLTAFFVDVVRIAVEHYDREMAERAGGER